MTESNSESLQIIIEQAKLISAGNYEQIEQLIPLTDTIHNDTQIAELAESISMMSVMVETREYSLKQKIEELRSKNFEIESLIKNRALLSFLLINVLLLLSVYIFILGIIYDGVIQDEKIANFIYRLPFVEIISIFIVWEFIKRSKFTMKDFGVNLNNWRQNISESLIVSVIIVALLIAFKYFANKFYPGYFQESQIFDLSYLNITYLSYLIIAPLQEFLTRGIVQGTMEKLIDIEHKGIVSILLTAFIFGAMHTMMSLNLAIISFVSGIVFGWLYYRHKSILGASICHFLIGNISGIMGYWTFFMKG